MTPLLKNLNHGSWHGVVVVPLLAVLLASWAPAEARGADVLASDVDVARLCAAHGSDCPCPGCTAFREACGIPCPPQPYCPPISPEGLPEPMPEGDRETLPDGAAEATPYGADQPSPATVSGPMTSLSTGLGAVAVASSASPSMIGDFFGGGYNYSLQSQAPGATVASAGGDRLLKFADNNSPLPQDRVFFNYNHFHNSVVDVRSRNQHTDRFMFGLERTFWDGLTSIEVRVPFAATVDAQQSVASDDTLAAEMGNLALAVKVLAIDRAGWSLAGGLGMIFPTGDDSVIFNSMGEEAVSFTNEAFYLQPFVGVYFRPNNRLFTQFVTQVNFDVSGDVVTISDPSFFSSGAFGSDRVTHQTLLFMDYSVGYWMYRSKYCGDWITGVAPMVELHYTSTLDDLDVPDVDGEVFVPDFRRDVLNITGGLYFDLWRHTAVKIAGVAPLRDGTDRVFDAEFGVQLIHRY